MFVFTSTGEEYYASRYIRALEKYEWQEFRIVHQPKIKIENSTRSVHSRLYGNLL